MDSIEDADIIARAVRLLLEQRNSEARVELQNLSRTDPVAAPLVDSSAALERPSHTARPNVSPPGLARVLTRDGWRCHYCGRKLVVAGVLELVGELCPGEFPFPPGHHMPVARTHPAAIRVYPNVDHIHAGSLGGHWTDETNLVAACTPCNELKSDRLGWSGLQRERDAWNGLSDCYRGLVERAGATRSYHVTWMRALGV